MKHMMWDLKILWGKRIIIWFAGPNPNCSRECSFTRFFIKYMGRPRSLGKLSGESDGPHEVDGPWSGFSEHLFPPVPHNYFCDVGSFPVVLFCPILIDPISVETREIAADVHMRSPQFMGRSHSWGVPIHGPLMPYSELERCV